MRGLKIHYRSAAYQSHSRAASSYRDIIGQRYTLTDNAESADVVIVHDEPHRIGDLLAACPELKTKYLIAYSVWEASRLPEAYKRPLEQVQEVWTCSRYSMDAFARHHPLVKYIPHVVECHRNASAEDYESVKQAIGYRRDEIRFLAIGRLWDKRKNLLTLADVFRSIAAQMPRARLIMKCCLRDRGRLPCHPQIVPMYEQLSEGQIDALYGLSDAYVSAHHGEGWGLTISDAMLAGRPVIATAYSGNMEFMDQDNSIPINYQEEEIRTEDRYGHFDYGMQWAYPHPESMAEALLDFYSNPHGQAVTARTRAATRGLERFGSAAVSSLVCSRLADIQMSLA